MAVRIGFIVGFVLALPLAAQPGCPAINFVTPAAAFLYSREPLYVSGLQRQTDGSLTEIRYQASTPFNRLATNPNYQNEVFKCTKLGQRTPAPAPSAPLANELGVMSRNVVIANLKGTGTPAILVLEGARLAVHFHDVAIPNSPETLYTIASSAESMLVADFNGDGKRDVAIVHDSQNGTVSILLGNGDGTLRNPVSYPVGSYPQMATAFDFNGDGRVDLAVANGGSNNVSILLANADGTFQPAVNYPAGSFPGSPVVADVNGDGKADIILPTGTSITILRGNGDGTFQAPTSFNNDFSTRFLATGDFNKDGKIDLAAADTNSGRLIILLGAGDGTFTQRSNYVLSYGAESLIVTDFDRDGIPDVVIAAGHPDDLSAIYLSPTPLIVFIGNGDGTFYGAPSYPVLASPIDMVAGDFNNDGTPDLAVVAFPGIDILMGQSGGKFSAATRAPGTCCIQSVAVGDFNKDGKLDLVASEYRQNNIRVLLGNGNGTFQNPTTFVAGTSPAGIAVGDLNGDGKLDLVIGQNPPSGTPLTDVVVMLGNGDGTFQTGTLLPSGSNPAMVVLRDLNNDGKLDLITVNNGAFANANDPGDITVRLGNGNGTFQAAVHYPAGINPVTVSIGDLNSDGKLDLVVAAFGNNTGADQLALLTGKGDGTFNPATFTSTDFGPNSIVIADFNADGKNDLLVAHCCGDVDLTFSLGNGDGTFQAEQHILAASPYRLIPNDFDGNGSPDLAVLTNSNGASSFVSIYLNVLGGTPAISSPTPGISFSAGSVTFTWTPLSGAIKYKLSIGSSAGGSDIFSQETTGTSLTVSNLPSDGRTLFVQIAAFLSGAYGTPGSYTYKAYSTPLRFVPLVPCRVMDTRGATGPLGGPFIGAGTTRLVPVQSSPCGIPANAAAYSLNITVVPRTGTLGFLTVWPAGQSQPGVSTLNAPDGSILANAAIVPAGTSGSINAFALNDTDLIVDINGFFVPPATSALQFFPLTPCRVLDTRNANATFGGPSIAGGTSRSFPIPSSTCTVPATAAAYSFNVTVVPQGFLGFLTAWPTGTTQPNVSTLNSLDGSVLANAAIVPAGTGGAVSFFANNTTNLVVDINGYFAPPGTGGLDFFTVTPCRVADTRSATGALGGPIMNGGTSRTFPLPTACGLPSTAAAYSLNMTVAPSGPLGFLTAWPSGLAQPGSSTLNAPKGLVVANAALVPAGTSGGVNVFVLNTTQVIIDTNGYFQ